MDEPESRGEAAAAPDGRSAAQIFLEQELARSRDALMSWEAGDEVVREGQRRFDETWGGIVRNAARHYGREATRDALERMGRSEDVGLMY